MTTEEPVKRTISQRFGFSRSNKSPAQGGRLTKRNPKELAKTTETERTVVVEPVTSDVPDYILYRQPSSWDNKPAGPYEFQSQDEWQTKETLIRASVTRQSITRQRLSDESTGSNTAPPLDLQKDLIDKDTGERKDLTEMMHALHYDETQDFGNEYEVEYEGGIDPFRPRGEAIITKLSAELWVQITDYLLPREAANLALTCKTALWLLGSRPFDNLQLPENKDERIEFLLPMDIKLPDQLFCFPCGQYHARSKPGEETLKPPGVLNPVFDCPNVTNNMLPPPRARIAAGRLLPFQFVQLATRARRFGPQYGIEADTLSRRWSDPWSEWKHQTRFHVAKNGHFLMRVVSQVWAEGGLTIAAKRMLLYSRDDYWPYFSCCAHWRDGVLMDLCKCALDHIPKPKPRTAYLGGDKLPPPQIVTMCSNCQPMRRCPKCPSEYLLELKLVEDKEVRRNHPLRFKQCLMMTRWCDLGNGSSPNSREWAAIAGEYDGFDSIEETGNRSVSSTFESAFTDSYPFQRLLSMNPDKIYKGEKGNDWY